MVNATGDAHPIHVHLVQFFVLGRQEFDLPAFLATGAVVPTGPFLPPDPSELFAPRDAVKAQKTDAVDRGLVTKIVMRFDLPNNAVVQSGDRLPYVWHCHILDHEDNDMMRPFEGLVERAEGCGLAGLRPPRARFRPALAPPPAPRRARAPAGRSG